MGTGFNEIGKEAQSYHTEGPYPWAAILGLVVDKFGIGWLYTITNKFISSGKEPRGDEKNEQRITSL